jgi:hypothetical protein
MWTPLNCLMIESVGGILCLRWRTFKFWYLLCRWSLGPSVNPLRNSTFSTLYFPEVSLDFSCFALKHESSFQIQSRRHLCPVTKHGIIAHWTFKSCRASQIYGLNCPIQATSWYLPAEIFMPEFSFIFYVTVPLISLNFFLGALHVLCSLTFV